MLNTKRVIIEKLILDEKTYKENRNAPLLDKKILNQTVVDIKVKPEGKKTFERKEFLNGYLK